MTPARWLGPEEVPPDLDRPAVWLARDDDPAWEALVSGVRASALDLADAALFTTPARSAARLRRRLLLRALTARTLGVGATDVVVERSAAGAIAVTAPAPLCASLSARDGWTMVGLSHGAIGVDVETDCPSEPLPLDALAVEEAVALGVLEPALRPAAFSRYWTAKEATLKAMGVGLDVDPSELVVQAAEPFARVRRGQELIAWVETRAISRHVSAVAAMDGSSARRAPPGTAQ